MRDASNTLFFKEKFSIRLNRNSDPMFILCDYDKRDYSVNMNLQHYHEFYEIFIPLEQNVAHLVDSKYYRLMQNDIVLLKPNCLHMSVYPKINEGQKRLIIDFRLADGISGLEHELKKMMKLFDMEVPILRFSPDITANVIDVLNDIFVIGKNRQNGWEIAFYAKFMELIWVISKNAPHNCYNEKKSIESKEQKIYYIQDYINTNYMEDISLEDIAEKFAISPYYLSHIFKSLTGLNFVNYVQSIRIRNVLQFLAYSDDSISDIINNCGFTSASQFNRVFHQFLGISPSSFRKSQEKQKMMYMGYMNPESEEKAPAYFYSRLNLKQRMKITKDGEMKIGLRAHDLGPMEPETLKEKLDILGVDTIQLAVSKSFPQVKGYISMTQSDIARIKEQKFDISVLGCYIDIAGSDEEKWHYELENFKKAICVASELNAQCVATETSDCIDENRERQFARIVDALSILLPVAKSNNVPIAIEPVIRHTINSPKMIERLLGAFDNDYLKLIFDPVNLLKDDGENNTFDFFDNIIDSFGDKFVAMHVKDMVNGERVPLGKGIMAKTLPHIAKALRFNIPLIREELPIESLESDLAFIRNTFS